MKQYRQVRLLLLLLLLIITGFIQKPVLAHERIEIGPYILVIGWVNEPAIVGERNALFLEVTENEEPVAGVEASLDAELLFADRTFRSNLIPTIIPGQYTIEVFPTVRGQYSVRLFGMIGNTEVNEVVEPEEVFPADRIQFPEPEPSIRELQKETQQQIAELASKTKTAQTIAIIGTGIGLVGLALAGWGLRQRH